MPLTILAFVLALALLIAVHEYGHYRVAVACGVRVLRFSVGFGKVIGRWQASPDSTEFVVCAFPLGGYVRMLDEREAAVPESQRGQAFNNQPLAARAAIVAAGPVFNLALAVLLYTGVNWVGVDQPAAVLASPTQGSVAANAGIQGGERVSAVQVQGQMQQPVRSFEDLRWKLAQAALQGQDMSLMVAGRGHEDLRPVALRLAALELREIDAAFYQRIGIVSPRSEPLIGSVIAGGAAALAGLQDGDRVRRVGALHITDASQLREAIRAQVRDGRSVGAIWEIDRGGRLIEMPVEPVVVTEGGKPYGRIGAYVGGPPEMVEVSYGPIDGVITALAKTWEMSALTVRMLGSMLVGEASLKNLNGPITIADYAGKSASQGATAYLMFLALISISLGVLNLLPLPVLDGGHLLYYLWEAVAGKGVSDAWMERLQRGGAAVLFLLMSVALYNDLTRILG